MSRLDYLVEHAGERVTSSSQVPDDDADLGLCVVAPIDPLLTGWLETDLGIGRGDAVVIRLPGGVMPSAEGTGLDPAVGRSVAAACYLHGCEEVLLLGLEDGGATRSTATAIDALRRAEVDRSAVDGADLRSFLGLQSEVRQGLLQAAAALRATAYLPSRLAVHAALVDPATGRLTVLESGYDKLRSVAEHAADHRGPVKLAAPTLPPMPDRWTPDGAVVEGDAAATASGVAQGIDPRLAATMAQGGRGGGMAQAAPRRPATSASRGAARAPTRPSAPRSASGQPVRARPAAPMAARPAAARPAPAPAPLVPSRGDDVYVDLAAGQVRFAGDTQDLPPELLAGIQAVAYFVHDVYDDDERAMVAADVRSAVGKGGAALIDALLQPLLHLGPERYRVLNEMLVLKEQLVELPEPVVGAVLTEMLR